MADISSFQILTLYPQQGDSLRALMARFVRSRLPSNWQTALASAARTTSTFSASIDTQGQDVSFLLDITAAAGVSGVVPFVQMTDDSGVAVQVAHTSITLTGISKTVGTFRNSQFRIAANTGGGTSGVAPLSSRIMFFINHLGTDSYTYSLRYQLLGKP